MKKTAFLLFFLLVSFFAPGQLTLDSLWHVWNNESAPDSSRILAIREIALDHYLYSKPDSAFYFAQTMYEFAGERNLKKEMADALNIQGISYYMQSDYDKALEYYQRSLKIKEEVSDKKGISRSLNNIGMIYSKQGDYPGALEYYQRSLKIVEEISDDKVMASILGNIGKIYKYQGNYPRALHYYQRSYEISNKISDSNGVAGILNNMGSIYMNQGFYPRALDYYLQSYKIIEEISDRRGMAGALNNIGLIYMNQDFYTEALDYFQRSYTIKEEISDKNGMAITLNNMGLIFTKQGNFPKALDYYGQSLEIREEISDKRGIAGILNNIGEIYIERGDYALALDYYRQSLTISEEMADKRGMAITLNNIGKLNNYQGDHGKAIKWCEKALLLTEEINVLWVQKNSCECLYDAYKEMGDNNQALTYYERVTMLDDSLQASNTAKELQRMEFARQMLKDSLLREKEKLNVQLAHEMEVEKKNQTRNIILLIAALLLFFVIGIYLRILHIRKSKQLIEKEKDRSDKLLLNILPSKIAEELKEKGKAEAKSFKKVTILFTDFKSFTKISENFSAERLVAEINSCFMEFDAICGKQGIEKIKTIGDSYMAAGGLPVPSDNSVHKTVMAALAMADFIISKKRLDKKDDDFNFEMRVGIHTGPVIAGIVGVTKFQYDIWGDAVNTASRMESSGEVGKVNISQATYELIKDDPTFRFQSRGKIKAKGKGEIEMWFVEKNTGHS